MVENRALNFKFSVGCLIRSPTQKNDLFVKISLEIFGRAKYLRFQKKAFNANGALRCHFAQYSAVLMCTLISLFGRFQRMIFYSNPHTLWTNHLKQARTDLPEFEVLSSRTFFTFKRKKVIFKDAHVKILLTIHSVIRSEKR